MVSGGSEAGSERIVQSRHEVHWPGFMHDENADDSGIEAAFLALCWKQPGQRQLSPQLHEDGNEGNDVRSRSSSDVVGF